MSWIKFAPLRYIISRAAKSHGFLDPLELLARLRGFAQPSEVGEPIELLRAGVVFHARGLINSKVIQQNLDWVWPYWVDRQYDPTDKSFLPRAFSVTHVNLTHRNWTAIGWPDLEAMPIVDPRGLLTPHHDGWSIDVWVLDERGETLLPSQVREAEQTLRIDSSPAVTTSSSSENIELTTQALVVPEKNGAVCHLNISAKSRFAANLIVAIRPANPEGVSFIHEVTFDAEHRRWKIDGRDTINLSASPDKHLSSNYAEGDVFHQLSAGDHGAQGHCKTGLLTAGAGYAMQPEQITELAIGIPLSEEGSENNRLPTWESLLGDEYCQFQCPEEKYTFLYKAAVYSLLLHSPRDVYPGPYTYRRFWFRDAAFILHALLGLGYKDRVERALHEFPQRQTALGFFRSQEGEWDSNGEVLWLLERYKAITGKLPDGQWLPIIKKAATWILHKRLSDNGTALHTGLMPAGFSAEHLGTNDYYYWDNFWSLAGLHSATRLLDSKGDKAHLAFAEGARKLEAAIDTSLTACRNRLGRDAMPASPYRRLDAGAIGSVAVSYPLQLWPADDARITDCLDFLLDQCFIDGAFFQDMIHSGFNAYLTLHVAQALLRNRDHRYLELMDQVAQLASPTGQWPEAIHPQTFGGCMGDGHHVWASAEWVMMIHNCFVREENNSLIIGSGVPLRWLSADQSTSLGPCFTAYGRVAVSLRLTPAGDCEVRLDANWHTEDLHIRIEVPGFEHEEVSQQCDRIVVRRVPEESPA